MTAFDLRQLEQWCSDALTFLPTPDMPKIQEMRVALIEQNSGKTTLFQIAEDLAEGIHDLPASQRERAQDFLRERHGFGYEVFFVKRLAVIRKAIRRGKIKDDGEYRVALELVSDTTLDEAIQATVADLIAGYESNQA